MNSQISFSFNVLFFSPVNFGFLHVILDNTFPVTVSVKFWQAVTSLPVDRPAKFARIFWLVRLAWAATSVWTGSVSLDNYFTLQDGHVIIKYHKW